MAYCTKMFNIEISSTMMKKTEKQNCQQYINNCDTVLCFIYLIYFSFVVYLHAIVFITHLCVMDIPIVLFNISSKFILYLECYLISPKNLKKLSKKIKQSKEYQYIIITKIWGVSITVMYHAMSLTVLYKTNLLPFWSSVHLVLGW